MLIKLRNTYHVMTFFTTMGGSMGNPLPDNITSTQVRIEELIEQLHKLGFVHKKIGLEFLPMDENTQKNLRDLITKTGIGTDPNEAFTRAAVRDYVIDVVRK